MSVCRKLPDGTIQKIAGHTILLDANASEIRQGRWNLVSTGVGWVEQNIIFTDPMPDNDYTVIIESDNQTWATQPGPYRITNKTTTGFILASFNDSNATGQANMNIAGTYTAYKLVKIEGYTALQNKVNNPDDTPTIDSMNLVTSDGVARAIENASAVWKGTRAEWNALPATDKVKYDLAVLTDTQLIKSVDRTDGSDSNVADLTGKIFRGTEAEWEALSAEEKDEYEQAETRDVEDPVVVFDPSSNVLCKNVESAAGVTTATLREFVKGMLDDIAMQTWENGSYAGKFQSTHAGTGDFGSWVGSYQCTKGHSGQHGTTVFGTANNKGFTAIWVGGTIGWDVKMCGYQQKFDEWTNLGTYNGSTLTIPANSASWIKIVGAYIDLGKDTFVPRFFANDIAITNWSIDPADNTLIVLCRNFSAVDVTLQKVWLTVIRN